MDILPRSNLPSYIEGNPVAKNPKNPTIRVESNGQSNDAAKLGKILVMPQLPLLTSTFSKSNGGLDEYCGPNASLMNGNWQTQPS